MRVYLLKDEDFQRLLDNIDRDPRVGLTGGSSTTLTPVEQDAHDRARSAMNYHVRVWIESVKR